MMRFQRAVLRLSWQRLVVAVVVGLIAWALGRHALYWVACETASHWTAAPKHWIAGNPESEFAGTEQRFAFGCALLAAALTFFRTQSSRAATDSARWLFDRMNGAIPKLLVVAIPTAVVWFLARAGIHALFFPAMHHPPSASDRGTELALTILVSGVAGSMMMVSQAALNAEWSWSEAVARRENVSPTLLRSVSGITSGPFDVPSRPGCVPTLVLGLLALPVFVPWLLWRILMAAAVLIGAQWLLGHHLASRQAAVYDLTTGSRLRSVRPQS